MKILLTAPPNTGKSTVIAKVVGRFTGSKRGIVAREILDGNGRRTGFTSVNEAGQSRQFMFFTDRPTEETIGGQFDVDVEAVDEFVVNELREGARNVALTYVDEIGQAQAKSQKFLDVVREILASKSSNVLGSILSDDAPWSLEFKRHPAVFILEVTTVNRDVLPNVLLAVFEHQNLLQELTDKQQAQVTAWLRELLQSNLFASAEKLFANALGYLVHKKIEQVSAEPLSTTNSQSAEYMVDGQTHKHRIIRNENGRFICDCDLANGNGVFSGKPAICSHEMSIRLLEIETLQAAKTLNPG